MKKNIVCGLLSNVALLLGSANALPQQTEQLERVIVYGQRETEVSVAGKTPTSLREIPHSVSVVDEVRLEEQNLTTVDAALGVVTGVTVVPNSDSQSQYRARGYAMSVMHDGIPAYNALSGFQQFDTIVYERLEVLRGPSGLLQGTSDPGGSINLVAKRASDRARISASATGGSWDAQRATLDATGPLNEENSLRARAALAWQQRDSFLELNHDERRVAYGRFEWDPLPDTTASLAMAWQDNETRAPYGGLPAGLDDRQLDVPRSTNVSPPWSRHQWKTLQYRGGLDHQFSDAWTTRAAYTRVEQDFFFHDAFATNGVRASDNTLPMGRRENDVDYLREAVDLYVAGKLRAFGRDHGLLFGFNHDAFTSRLRGVDRTSALQSVRIGFDDRANLPDFSLPYERGTLTNTSQNGWYGQARLRLLEPLTLLLGTRLSEFESRSRAIAPTVPTAWSVGGRLSAEWVPYGGVVYAVHPDVSLYGSYSAVFVPQSTLLRADGSPLDPRVGGQYEAGAKASLFKGRLDASVALFLLRDSNRSLSDPQNPGFYTMAGLVESKGWEAELTGMPLPNLELQAGYSRLDSRYVRADPARIGTMFDSFEPEYTWRLWAVQRLPMSDGSHWTIGLGLTGQSRLEAAPTISTQRWQPAYSLLSAMVSYTSPSGLLLQVNAANLLDEQYYARVGGINSYNSYGTPRNVSLTLRFSR